MQEEEAVDDDSTMANRRRFLIVMRFTIFFLQLLCCLATLATFSRLLDQYKLPITFMALPGLLFFLTGLERCYLLHDASLNSIIRGAVTGFLSGFYATVVNDYFSHPDHTTHNKLILSLGQYEFLHIPVIAGSLMCLFCILFTQFPPLRITILSFALAICSMALFSLGTIFFSDRPDTATINKTLAFAVFISVFLLGLVPFVTSPQAAWLLTLMFYVLSLIWQVGYLDSQQWQWRLERFPISGCLTPLLLLFLVDVVQVHVAKNSSLRLCSKKKRSHSFDWDDDKHKLHYDENEDDEDEEHDHLSNALTWHCVCYILERTTLTLILEKQYKRKFKTDTWFCCMGVFFVYLIFVNYRQISVNSKLTLTYLGLLVYFCVGVSSGIISNGYFIDSLLGIVFLTISTVDIHD